MFKVENLSVIYPNGLQALKKVNIDLSDIGICGIIGPNGGGKTTFIKGILNLIPAEGKITFKDFPIKKWAKKTAYVEQKRDLDLDFPISVFQCVLLGTYPTLGFFRKPGKKEKNQAKKALEKVELSHLSNHQIGELSGGQFQRILIARTIVQNADLIFLDEPFVGIDVQSEAIIVELLKNLAKEGKSIFIVHHDLSKVRRYFDHIILINKTCIASGAVEKTYTKENLKKTFEVLDNPLFT